MKKLLEEKEAERVRKEQEEERIKREEEKARKEEEKARRAEKAAKKFGKSATTKESHTTEDHHASIDAPVYRPKASVLASAVNEDSAAE